MKLKIKNKYVGYYLQAYTMELLSVVLHECSHYLFGIITWILGYNSIPTMHFTRMFYVEDKGKNEEGHCESMSYNFHAHVNLIGYSTVGSVAFVASAPIFLTIALFAFLPYWTYPLLLACIKDLWISAGDYEQIEEYIDSFKKKDVNEFVFNNKEELNNN